MISLRLESDQTFDSRHEVILWMGIRSQALLRPRALASSALQPVILSEVRDFRQRPGAAWILRGLLYLWAKVSVQTRGDLQMFDVLVDHSVTEEVQIEVILVGIRT